VSFRPYVVYTDGACKGNPGPGAAAAVVTAPDGTILREFVKAYTHTTNNRMELMGAIVALKALPQADLTVITDSQYVYKGITSWVHNWKKKGWLTAGKQPVENKDLWEELDALARAHEGPLRWEWVRGHNGSPGNERADVLASKAAAAV
jgi:ribonuclease HI